MRERLDAGLLFWEQTCRQHLRWLLVFLCICIALGLGALLAQATEPPPKPATAIRKITRVISYDHHSATK